MKKIIVSTLLLCISAICYSQVPEDSLGIWAIVDGQAKRMHKIKYQGTKVSGALASMYSFGIAKTKSKLEFAGVESDTKFSGKATFRFYFGFVPAEKMSTLGAFSSENSIKDFSVSKFQIKKDKRQLTTVSVSLWSGVSGGAKADKDVTVTSNEISDGVYDVEVTAAPGHYCFVCNDSGAGGYTGAYDFDIEE